MTKTTEIKEAGGAQEPEPRREPLGEIFTRDFLLLSTINLSMFFGFQMLNIGLPMYMAQLGAAGQVIGLATTLMTIMATFMRVFAGALLDRFGRWGMLISGMVIMVCAIASFTIFPIVGVILGLRMLHGIGWGMGSTATSTIAADIIPKRRFAEGMGYFALTTAISSAIAPAASIEIIQGAGAETMILVSVGVTVLALVLSVAEALISRKRGASASVPLQVRSASSGDRLGSQGAVEAVEATEGSQGVAEAAKEAETAEGSQRPAEAVGSSQGALEGPGGAAGTAGPSVESGASEPLRKGAADPRVAHSKLETLFERRAVLPGMLMLLVNIGFGCITTFIALHAEAQNAEGVSAYFIVYAVITLASRPFIGKLIDRYGYRIPAITSTLCTAGTLMVIGLSNNVFMFATAGVLGGLGIGTSMSTFQAMAVASVEPWRRGVATSTYMTAFDLGIAIGSLLGGVVADSAGYTVMYFVVAIFPIVAGIMSAVVVKKGMGGRSEREQLAK